MYGGCDKGKTNGKDVKSKNGIDHTKLDRTMTGHIICMRKTRFTME